MRIRALKPGFFLNERLADLSPWHRLLFAGLWTVADRDGRLEDRPRKIKAQIFPYDDVDVEPMLADLARAHFIVRYRIEDLCLIAIPSWRAHQFPRPDEKPSVLPAYEPRTERTSVEHAADSIVADSSLSSRDVDTPQQMGSGICEPRTERTSGEHAADSTVADSSLSSRDVDTPQQMGSGIWDLGYGVRERRYSSEP
jgi:hypothetical protein